MDLQNIFGLLEELFVDPIIFLGFVIFFLDLTNSSTVSFEKTLRFLGFAKYFWIVPFRLPYIRDSNFVGFKS